jgi:hypothetical protein
MKRIADEELKGLAGGTCVDPWSFVMIAIIPILIPTSSESGSSTGTPTPPSRPTALTRR